MLKVKNNLLGIVLILTTLGPGVSVSRAVLEEITYIMGQRMHEDSEVSGCASTGLSVASLTRLLLFVISCKLLPSSVRKH